MTSMAEAVEALNDTEATASVSAEPSGLDYQQNAGVCTASFEAPCFVNTFVDLFKIFQMFVKHIQNQRVWTLCSS